MGNVIVVYKVLPDEKDHFESVKKSILELNPQRLEEESIAFGLKALKVTMIIPDKTGEMDKLDNRINSIPNVNSVETLTVSRSF